MWLQGILEIEKFEEEKGLAFPKSGHFSQNEFWLLLLGSGSILGLTLNEKPVDNCKVSTNFVYTFFELKITPLGKFDVLIFSFDADIW